jgi:hypothetical protein
MYILHYFETVSWVHLLPHVRSAFDGKAPKHELHIRCRATLSVYKYITLKSNRHITDVLSVGGLLCTSPAVEVCTLFIYMYCRLYLLYYHVYFRISVALTCIMLIFSILICNLARTLQSCIMNFVNHQFTSGPGCFVMQAISFITYRI